jgi:hypothetical protein
MVTWVVVQHDHRLAKAETEIITQAYKERRLLVGPGRHASDIVGGYTVRADFHLTWYEGRREHGGGEGSWCCNTCFETAMTEHDKDECHTCSDWGVAVATARLI